MYVDNYLLDLEQQKIVKDDSNHILVVAGAGSGKTLTILGKIIYLIKNKKIKEDEIMCISFTNASSLNLKNKLKKIGYDIDVYTFHKLGFNILKRNKKFSIAESDTLENIIHLFFLEDIYKSDYLIKKINIYFKTKNYKDFYQKNYSSVYALERLVATFIHLMKSNNYELDSFIAFKKKIKKILNFNYKKENIFLILTLNIYLLYQNYLKENNELDFDDLLIEATKLVNKTTFYKKIKYIIIDEYQDTSLVRFNLIKSILDKTNSKLLVVGDDFQSIYRFTGCDLNIFLNFNKYFKDSKVLKIQNTYRNSKELIKIAGNFVMKNKKQMKKKLNSNKSIDKPINIIYYDDPKKAFLKLILDIYKETKKPILILGRNNKDIYDYIDNNFKLEGSNLIYLKDNIKLTYLTVHKSKGLEEENILIINLKNDILGFPSQIREEKILRLIVPKKDYLFAEERRLFYVALTRTKNKAYLLVPKKNPSIFVKEIIKDNKKFIRFSTLY